MEPRSLPVVTISDALRRSGLDPVDARVLLQHALQVNHAHVIAHGERTLTSEQLTLLESMFERRRHGEPVAYIVGHREFYGRRFVVSPAVLIPRPETEQLVDLALDRLRGIAAPRVLDLGTGSGCIAITISLERPDARVLGIDASTEALAIATRNARELAADNIALASGNWFAGVPAQSFDLVVANPPYVAVDDVHLAQGDVRFEPRSALVAGPAGLDEIARIVSTAPEHLHPGGWLLLEHGWDQADAVAQLLASGGFAARFTERDLGGQPRISGGRR